MQPLGEFGEQVVEAAHQKLDKIWQFYIVKMVETEDHGRAFEKCVNHFNSMNIHRVFSSPEKRPVTGLFFSC